MGHCRKLWGACSLVIFLCSMLHLVCGAPDSLGIPIIKSLLQGSSEGLKDLVHSHSSRLLPQLTGEGGAKSPQDINNLISKFSPKQGRLDPVVVEMLSAFDRNYRDTGGSSTESLQFPDEGSSNRVASSTEENGIIWQDTTSRPRKRDRSEASKFSSRYRSNKTESTPNIFTRSHNDSANVTDPSDSHVLPFDHITDPNIRNHRLYDWEFETYKNFTHIDQAEDLMADEDHATETKVSIVAAPPPPTMQHPSQQITNENAETKGESIIPSGWATKPNGSKSKRVKVKGMPHIVISLEDTSEPGFRGGVHVPGSYYKLPMDSAEPSGHRPREPLRHSSTENIVYVHGSAEEVPYPYRESTDRDREHDHEVDGRYSDRSHKFRPSAADLSDAVFIDPDQDFFTSTVKSSDMHHQDDQEISSETLPKRRRKKLRKITKKEEIDELAQSDRFSHRNGDRHMDDSDSYHSKDSDRPTHGISYSPEYSRSNLNGNVDETHGRAHLPVRKGYNAINQVSGPQIPIKPSKYLGTVENTRIKADRVLYPSGMEEYSMNQGHGQGQGQHYENLDTPSHHHDGGIGNYYSLHSDPGLHSNLGPQGTDPNTHPFAHQNHELTSTEYLGMGNRFQTALSALNPFGHPQPAKKLQASVADQVIAPGNVQDFYHPYAAEDHHVNQYYDDGYHSWSNTFFILAAIIAFTAVFALLLPTFITSGRIGKKHHRHDLDDEDLNSSTYAGSSSNNNNNNNYHYDNTTDDVGQNPDLWQEIKGAYNDLVSLFRGDYSLLSKFKKEAEGPKIVFRDDEDQDESDDDDEEDDEKNENSLPLRNRKRERYVKKQQQLQKKQQQLKLQKKQQQQQQKSTKKTLVSKTNIQAGRDNKDNGKTINATSVNNLVVVSGSSPITGPLAKTIDEEEHSSPRAVTGFIFPDNSTMATFPIFNTTAGAIATAADSFLNEWAQVQLINNH